MTISFYRYFVYSTEKLYLKIKKAISKVNSKTNKQLKRLCYENL